MGRAVSDTLGFVLVFGIIVSTVAVVYVGGFGALTEARDTQQFANTERAFDVMDANVEDITVRGAPSRATEVLLADGELTFGQMVSFNVTTASGDYYSTTVRPLVYRSDSGAELVYANGALFRQYGDRAVMFDAPRVAADGGRTIVPYVVSRSRSGNVVAVGTDRVLVRTVAGERAARVFRGVDANLTVTSPRAAAWERYLESEFGVACARPVGGNPEKVTCPLPGDDVYVQAVVVNVALT